jgi:tetratricopeptide (TPR) repeat protein
VWDDDGYLTTPALQSLRGLGRIWFDVGATEQYYPLLHSAFWLEHRLWGDAPFGYHLVGILLHAGSAGLFAAVLRRLEIPGAWLAAFVFALHPIAVESVAWIAEQKNTLSTFLYLGSALAYLGYDRDRRVRSYALALTLFAAALLAKTVTATLPAALLVVFWWRRGRLSWRRDVAPLLPWFALGAAAGLFSGWVERTFIGAQGPDFNLTWVQRLLVAGRDLWFYAGKLLWPAPLVFIYPRWSVDPGAIGQYFFPLAAAVLLAILWRLRRRSRAPLAAFLCFTGALFPTLGFLNVYAFIFSYVADHWAYLACLSAMAPLAAAAVTVAAYAPEYLRRAGFVALLGTLIALGALTWRRCEAYRDSETLYRTTLAQNPDCWMAHLNLGVILVDAGAVPEAIDHYREALRLKPDYADTHFDLGSALVKAGRPAEAIAEFETALRLKPGFSQAHINLGNALVRSGRAREAIDHFAAALDALPDSAEAHAGLGAALFSTGDRAGAMAQDEEALRLKPGLADAHYNLGVALAAGGNLPEAIRRYEEALRLKPDYVEACANLGGALANSGRLEEAAAQFERALRLRPDFTAVRVNLGETWLRLGRTTDAVDQFSAAARLKPADAGIHRQLGLALRALGRNDEAAEEFTRAAALTGGGPRAP